MTDREKWERAVAAVRLEYGGLSQEVKERVLFLLKRVQRGKERVHQRAAGLNGAEICAACGGQCCMTGKHHFTVIELLTYLAKEEDLFTPRFDSGRCPYLGDDGCLMSPSYRPFNCITFNCEQVDSLSQRSEAAVFMHVEKELREAYADVEGFFGNRFLHGLFINFERDILQRRQILRGVAADGAGVDRQV
ncbi:hypothetical protein [Geobacter sp. DSM 9736]|uniref:hypothetical protein n=1 Tax=Geobacter sp. DSM 9736 TaxID=1277350 RepID=UPI000B5050E3|nr:hypothetical protein [Geobacter sp. DSM 9736]